MDTATRNVQREHLDAIEQPLNEHHPQHVYSGPVSQP